MKYSMKKIISIVLSIVLVTGLMANNYQNASASDESNSGRIAIGSNVYIANQNFENEAEYTGKWRNQSESLGTLEFVTDPDNSNNHVLKYTVSGLTSGAATFDFHNGDVQIFEQGKTYVLSYKYKSSASFHGYHAGLDSSWTTYSSWTSSSDEWKTMSVEITPNSSLEAFQIGIQILGNGTFYLDDLTISEKGKEIYTVQTDFGYVSKNSWYLPIVDSSVVTGSFYNATMIVDGEEQTVCLEKQDNQFVIWDNFFNMVDNAKSYPKESLEIKKDTYLYQIDPNVSGWKDLATDGQILKFDNAISVKKNGLNWSKENFVAYQNFENEAEYKEKWRNQSPSLGKLDYVVDPTDENNQVLKYTVSGLTSGAATFDFHNGDVQIFEQGKTYVLSYKYKSSASFHGYHANLDSDWTTYSSWTSGSDEWKTMSVEITPNSSLKAFQIGIQILGDGTFYLDDFRITKKEELESIQVGINNVTSESSWYFDADNIDKLTGQFYSTTMLVDGKEQIVCVEKSDNGKLVIWNNFFTGGVPVEKLEIKKDTVMYQVDANNSFTVAIENGQRLKFANDLTAIKTELGWCLGDFTVYQDFENEVDYTGKWRNQKTDLASMEFVVDPDDENNHVLKYTVDGLTSGGSAFDFNNKDNQIFKKGKSYTLSFRYKSTASFNAYHAGIDSSWNIYNSWASPTNEWKTMIVEFTPNESLGYFQIGFELLGDGTFYLDDFKISVLDESSVKDTTDNPDYFNIGNGTKYLVTSSNGAYTFKKDGVAVTETEVDTVGEYILSRAVNGVINIKKIVLYKYGDVDANNVIDVADIVAIKKLIAGKATYSLAGTKGADINTDAVTDDFDAHALRYKIANGTLVEAKANTALNGAMPIIGYDGPYKSTTRDYLTNDIYGMVKDMGFNTVIANRNEIGTDYATSSKMLELAEANDLKVYLNNGYAVDPTNKDNIVVNPDKLKNITAPYETYKSFAGYYVYDEPFSSDISGNTKYSLDTLKPVLNQLKGYTNINNYLNLYPYISTDLNTSLGSSGEKVSYDNYKIYAKKALDNGADYLSYDLYLRGNGNKYNILTEEFYTNLSWSRKIGLENNKPFYAFVQVGTDFVKSSTSSTKQKNLTTVQEMYLEANAALAMGAKGMAYYSLIQPEEYANWKQEGSLFIKEDSGTDIYRSGLINVNGAANHGENSNSNYDYYNAAKKINGYIAKIDEVLMHSTNNGIIATDTKIKGYIGDASITVNDKKSGVISSVSGNNVLVGCFDYFGKDAYMIVNTSTSASTTATLTFDSTYSLSSMTMEATDWAKNSSNTFSATLGAGESVLVVVD